MRWPTGWILAGVFALGGITGCSLAGAQLFQRTDTQKEIEIGRQVARETERETRLSINSAMVERVRRIGEALVQSMPAKTYPYSFKVLASPQINAFCLPGGFVYVYEGLLVRLPDDNALAFVLGHEITHASHRHWAKMNRKMDVLTTAAILGSILLKSDGIPSFAHSLLAARYSRDNEEDADKGGLDLYWAAGFDLDGVIRAMELLKSLDARNTTAPYFQSHPSGAHRLQRMQQMSEELKGKPRPSLPAQPDVSDSLPSLLGDLPKVEVSANRWFPLAVGNSWTYKVTSAAGSTLVIVTVSGAIAVPGGSVYRSDVRLGKGAVVPYQTFATKTDVWRRNRPAEFGSKWIVDCMLDTAGSAPGAQPDSRYSVEPPEQVTTPCGTFVDTLKVKKQTGDRITYWWFAAGVGLIKRESLDTGVTELLASYSLQPAARPE